MYSSSSEYSKVTGEKINCWKCNKSFHSKPESVQNLKVFCDSCSGLKPLNSDELDFETKQNTTKISSKFYILGLFALIAATFYYHRHYSSGSEENHSINDIENLKKEFPLQKNQTWKRILSVLEKKPPAVKSLILLHGNDTSTSECLKNKLVFIYCNKNVTLEDVTFQNGLNPPKDFGEVLEYHKTIIKKHRVLATNLNNISGSIARVFHYLCDDVSSEIKPSLFIFTLRTNKDIRNLKLVERATVILREIWKELPVNEIYPLLSRIVKIVVEIVPENYTEHCSRN